VDRDITLSGKRNFMNLALNMEEPNKLLKKARNHTESTMIMIIIICSM
jgi:hypothetical protein